MKTHELIVCLPVLPEEYCWVLPEVLAKHPHINPYRRGNSDAVNGIKLWNVDIIPTKQKTINYNDLFVAFVGIDIENSGTFRLVQRDPKTGDETFMQKGFTDPQEAIDLLYMRICLGITD
jgi:hypothetical protein